jgi:hypothetical protein
LEGFAGFADAQYSHSSFSNSGSLDSNTAAFGLGAALPVAEIPNLNWQVEGSYGHQWSDSYVHANGLEYSDSAEVWNFGFSPFLAYGGSRWGLNLNYLTLTHFGHLTSGGGFMEWYLNEAWTLSAKGGYISSGGTPFGGHGHYLGAGATFYALPDLAISAGVAWTDIVTNGSAVGCLHCQLDVGGVSFGLDGEWLPMEDWGVAIFAAYAHTAHTDYTIDNDEDAFRIGVRYYTGMGTLTDHHRNGNLRSWLRGTGLSGSGVGGF